MLEQTAGKAFDSLFDRGVLGTVCVLLILLVVVLGLVIRALYRDLRVCNDRSLQDRARLVEAVEAAKDGAERSESAFRSLQALMETRGQALGDLSYQVGIVAEKVQHGFGNVAQSLESFVRLIERDRGR